MAAPRTDLEPIARLLARALGRMPDGAIERDCAVMRDAVDAIEEATETGDILALDKALGRALGRMSDGAPDDAVEALVAAQDAVRALTVTA